MASEIGTLIAKTKWKMGELKIGRNRQSYARDFKEEIVRTLLSGKQVRELSETLEWENEKSAKKMSVRK